MTKVQTTAARLVRAILQGEWTDEAPSWADNARYDGCWTFDTDSANYTRAVQTAEAFVIYFRALRPNFDEKPFLRACGLTNRAK